MKNKDIKYRGVYRKNSAGRKVFRVRFHHEGKRYEFGHYKDERECARAYDLYVIKNNLPKKTNFFKKKVAY